ncbi:hypothetical protein M3181_18215 [Mesobacillus maritimus]|uniref:hypothetical protein n=1 Tax=Mesobacillus maritimus TaxID=1643336 RepID=UPI00203EEB87|nr:hypothetical protein [Mesobacillus maritimus]MCM3670898.1 hypothetical protein [Mesobacillus maritimus]
MLMISLLISVSKQGIKCSKGMFLALYSMFGISVVWLIDSLQYYGLITLTVSVNNPPVLIMYIIIGFFLGTDDELWFSLKKIVPLVSIFFTILSLITAIEFNIEYTGARMAESSLMTYFILSLWATAFWIFTEDRETVRVNITKWVIVLILVVVALITNSRGWLLQSLFLLLYRFITVSKSRRITMIFLQGMIVALIIIGAILVREYLSTAYVNLVERLDADTRTTQLSTFFSQVSIFQLIFGQGVNAKYIWNGTPYGFIDNQLILMCFRYGILPVFVYLYILVKGIFIGVKNNRNEKYFLLMWLAALLGLSVYFNMDMNISNLITMMLMGHLYTDNRKKQLVQKGI